MSNTLQNAVYIPSQDKYYLSFYRHDFIGFTTNDGQNHFIDGGSILADGGYYFRASFSIKNPPNDVVPFFISTDDDFTVVREKLLWGTRGKDGKQPLTYLPFKNLELDHLKAILDYSDKLKIPLDKIQKDVIKYWIQIKT